MYNITISDRAVNDLVKLKRNEPNAFKKVEKLFLEIMKHPRTGTGQVEQLKYCQNTWSRCVTKKHRIVYCIYDETVEVLVLSAYGHYDDK